MFNVVIYDVKDDKRRNHLHRKLKNFGEPVQYSAFEANLRPKQIERMRKVVQGIIEDSDDRVRIYFLCEACKQRTEILGEGVLTGDPNILLL
jgi:CRISPR-associated protein Cas2